MVVQIVSGIHREHLSVEKQDQFVSFTVFQKSVFFQTLPHSFSRQIKKFWVSAAVEFVSLLLTTIPCSCIVFKSFCTLMLAISGDWSWSIFDSIWTVSVLQTRMSVQLLAKGSMSSYLKELSTGRSTGTRVPKLLSKWSKLSFHLFGMYFFTSWF